MAVSRYIKNENAVYLALGFNVNQSTPLDARLVVTKYEGLTQASQGDNVFYDGIVVSVVDDTEDKNGLYQLIHMPASNINNWHKIATEAEIKSIENTLSNVTVNGVRGVRDGNGVNVTISGDSIHLGANYDGSQADNKSPLKGDTINEAIKKIVNKISENKAAADASANNLKKKISENKAAADASANDLNNKISKVSGDAVTNVSLDGSKTKLLITKNGNNNEIPLTDLVNIYRFDSAGDTDHNVKFTTTGNFIQGNITSIDCGEYDG